LGEQTLELLAREMGVSPRRRKAANVRYCLDPVRLQYFDEVLG
jgi:hypothetical protein